MHAPGVLVVVAADGWARLVLWDITVDMEKKSWGWDGDIRSGFRPSSFRSERVGKGCIVSYHARRSENAIVIVRTETQSLSLNSCLVRFHLFHLDVYSLFGII